MILFPSLPPFLPPSHPPPLQDQRDSRGYAASLAAAAYAPSRSDSSSNNERPSLASSLPRRIFGKTLPPSGRAPSVRQNGFFEDKGSGRKGAGGDVVHETDTSTFHSFVGRPPSAPTWDNHPLVDTLISSPLSSNFPNLSLLTLPHTLFYTLFSTCPYIFLSLSLAPFLSFGPTSNFSHFHTFRSRIPRSPSPCLSTAIAPTQRAEASTRHQPTRAS